MAIGINDLDDDDFGMGFENQPNGEQEPEGNQEPSHQPQQQNEDDDFVADFLKTRGIDDITKIKFEDENNQIVERDWNSLTKEEKINILNTPLDSPEEHQQLSDQLDDEEIQLLQTIRNSNLTPSQYIELLKGQAEPQEPQYKIDDLSDDELFLLDLESRVGELSDELAAQALNNAKQNEELFKKQVEGIRKEYKEREDFKTQQEQAEIEQQQQEAYNAYQENVVNAIDSFNSIGNLDLNFEDSDKEELAEFMLSQDQSGNNYLYRALQEPENLVKAAWFILNGEDAFNSISDYFTNQIKLVSESQYKKGFEEGRNNTQPSRPTLVFGNNSGKTSIKDLDDLDFE